MTDGLSEDERESIDLAFIDAKVGSTKALHYAVERILAARLAAALTEVVARSEAVSPRESLRLNERRTYWLGANDVLRVVRGYRDNLTRQASTGE